MPDRIIKHQNKPEMFIKIRVWDNLCDLGFIFQCCFNLTLTSGVFCFKIKFKYFIGIYVTKFFKDLNKKIKKL